MDSRRMRDFYDQRDAVMTEGRFFPSLPAPLHEFEFEDANEVIEILREPAAALSGNMMTKSHYRKAISRLLVRNAALEQQIRKLQKAKENGV